MSINKLIITADGGSRGNPGKSACGFVVYTVAEFIQINGGKIDANQLINLKTNLIHKKGDYLGVQTNNYAEWTGLLKAMEWLSENYVLDETEVQVLMDSNLVVQQLLKKWKIKDTNLQNIAKQVFTYINQIKELQASHIYREYNKEADSVVNEVLDNL